MRIYLVRHGESLGNVDKTVHERMADHAIPLSDRGRAQAAETGTWLDREASQWSSSRRGPPARVWTSPYRRARETAELASKGLEASRMCDGPLDHVLLAEQQFGLFDGIPDDQLAVRYPAEHAHYAKHQAFEGRFWARMPLGESRFDVAVRVHQAFGTFHRDADRHDIETIVVVCHGVTMRAFAMMWLHKSPEWSESQPNPKNGSVWMIENDVDHGIVFEPEVP